MKSKKDKSIKKKDSSLSSESMPFPKLSSDSDINESGSDIDALQTPVIGVLNKWVNFGRGWRPRLFILEHGVFSYFKVHGSKKIPIAAEIQNRPNAILIGDEVVRLEKKRGLNGEYSTKRTVLGKVHVQISSFRESQSDDRKFYVFSGTKMMHLRAESSSDRSLWMNALHGSKNSVISYMSPIDDIPESEKISTDTLKQYLMENNVKESVIEGCENIIKEDIFPLLIKKLDMEKRRKKQLLNYINQLKTEKEELELRVVEDARNLPQNAEIQKTQSVRKTRRPSVEAIQSDRLHPLPKDKTENESDEEDEEEEEEDEEDDEEETFFEAEQHFPASKSLPLPTSLSMDGIIPIEEVGFHYPSIPRRTKLPEPKTQEKPVSLWSIIKDNVGKDLNHVCLPVYFNEPTSTLQKCFEELEYSWLLDQAAEWGKKGDSVMRAIFVATFAATGYSATVGRSNKPFNPLLGETFEAKWEDKGLKFIAEKVNHHPTTLACHCEGRGWTFFGDCTLKNKFWGASIQLDPVGLLTLTFDDGETFTWEKVTTSITNLILGKPTVDHHGIMKIMGNRGINVKMVFKEKGFIDRNPHQVKGTVQDDHGGIKASILGKWDHQIYYILGDSQTKPSKDSFDEAVLVWKKSSPPPNPTKYNLTSFAITLNEITPDLKDVLPPTDCRLRPDQRALEDGLYDLANDEKLRLEQKQRRARKAQEHGWKPLWFEQTDKSNVGKFVYKGGYWEAREARDWSKCPNIFALDEAP